MKKSVKVPTLADYLLKECGLLSWLFSVLSIFGERLGRKEKQFSLSVMELVLKVLPDFTACFHLFSVKYIVFLFDGDYNIDFSILMVDLFVTERIGLTRHAHITCFFYYKKKTPKLLLESSYRILVARS